MNDIEKELNSEEYFEKIRKSLDREINNNLEKLVNQSANEIQKIQDKQEQLRKIEKQKIKDQMWFRDYAFLISYGQGNEFYPIGSILEYEELALVNDSLDMEAYNQLPKELKEKTMQAVYTDEDGDLWLRIPIGPLMEIRNFCLDVGKDNSINLLKNVLIEEKEDINLKGLKFDFLEATIESIIPTEESYQTKKLGTNYTIYPIDMEIYNKLMQKIIQEYGVHDDMEYENDEDELEEGEDFEL